MPKKTNDVVTVKSPQMNTAVLSMQNKLKQNRDFRGGAESIFLNKKDYFSQLEKQSDDQFKAMVEMAPMYILYPKVVDGFVGVVFSKPPILSGVNFPEKKEEIKTNVDMLGNSLDQYSEMVIKETLENGFCATLNEYSDSEKRPYFRFIKPEQFVSLRPSNEDGYPSITKFIFSEEVEVDDPENEFESKIVNQYTVLDMANNPDNKDSATGKEKVNYRQRIFQSIEAKDIVVKNQGEDLKLISSLFPRIDSKFFDSIPIKVHGSDNNNFTIKKSILQDISDMNISVMQRTVDQVFMLHWTALPTPYIIGSEAADSPDTIGPSEVWYVENPEAKVGMLEFSGKSAKAHQDFIDNLLYIMAVMGAQILKKEGVSRETATSVLVRTNSQTSLVSTLVKNVSEQIKGSLSIHLKWGAIKVGADYQYKLNDDFIKVDMEPNAQIALVKSWLDGAISHESLFNKMKEGELIDTNRTFEAEMESIRKNPPPFFLENLRIKAAEEAASKAAEVSAKQQKSTGVGSGGEQGENGNKGSNLENGNVPNPLGTE